MWGSWAWRKSSRRRPLVLPCGKKSKNKKRTGCLQVSDRSDRMAEMTGAKLSQPFFAVERIGTNDLEERQFVFVERPIWGHLRTARFKSVENESGRATVMR